VSRKTTPKKAKGNLKKGKASQERQQKQARTLKCQDALQDDELSQKLVDWSEQHNITVDEDAQASLSTAEEEPDQSSIGNGHTIEACPSNEVDLTESIAEESSAIEEYFGEDEGVLVVENSVSPSDGSHISEQATAEEKQDLKEEVLVIDDEQPSDVQHAAESNEEPSSTEIIIIDDDPFLLTNDDSKTNQTSANDRKRKASDLQDYDVIKSKRLQVDVNQECATDLTDSEPIHIDADISCGNLSPASKKLQGLAKGKLSNWILRFSKPVGKKEMLVPEIEPAKDYILEDFGKSYALMNSSNLSEVVNDEQEDSSSENEADVSSQVIEGAEMFREKMIQASAVKTKRARSLSDLSGEQSEAEHEDVEEEQHEQGSGSEHMLNGETPSKPVEEDLRMIKAQNVDFSCSEDLVKETFEKYGKVETVEAKKYKNGRPSGTMLVLFASQKAAEQAMSSLQDEMFVGRPLRLTLMSPLSTLKPSEKRYYLAGEDLGTLSQCSRCLRFGHSLMGCTFSELKEKCNICAKTGHSFKECPSVLCFNCSGFGHTNKECKEPRCQRKILCTDCGSFGHKFSACQKHQRVLTGYNARCTSCGERGHFTCTENETHQNQGVFCYNCGEKDHEGFECTKYDADACIRNSGADLAGMEDTAKLKRRQSTGSCFYCQQPGHVVSNCPQKALDSKKCFKCNQPGHESMNCPDKAWRQRVDQVHAQNQNSKFYYSHDQRNAQPVNQRFDQMNTQPTDQRFELRNGQLSTPRYVDRNMQPADQRRMQTPNRHGSGNFQQHQSPSRNAFTEPVPRYGNNRNQSPHDQSRGRQNSANKPYRGQMDQSPHQGRSQSASNTPYRAPQHTPQFQRAMSHSPSGYGTLEVQHNPQQDMRLLHLQQQQQMMLQQQLNEFNALQMQNGGMGQPIMSINIVQTPRQNFPSRGRSNFRR